MSNVNTALLVNLIEREIESWDQTWNRMDHPTGATFHIGPFVKIVLDGTDIKAIGESPVQKKKTVNYRTDILENAIRRSVRFAVHFHLSYNQALKMNQSKSAVAIATVEALVANPAVAAEIVPTVVTENGKKSKRQKKAEALLATIQPAVETLDNLPVVEVVEKVEEIVGPMPAAEEIAA